MTTPDAPEVRVALIGYGYAGRTFHAPLIRSVPGLALRVVASSRPADVHADLPGVTVVPDALAAARSDDVDLVVIASPNDTHHPLARAALHAGKHVVVDKPFTVTTDEARELIRLARERGRLLSVFHNRRWDADFLTVRQLVRSGALGNVAQFESHFDRYRPAVRARWREQDVPGGGVWYDLGPHLLDQAVQLFGPPRAVSAHLARVRDGAVTDDWAHVLLEYDRMRAVLHASMLTAGGTARFTLHGTRGSFEKHGLDAQEDALKAGMPPGSPGWRRDPQGGTLYAADPETGEVKQRAVPNETGDYRAYYAGVHAAITAGAANPVPPEEALTVMELLELAARAAHEGRTLPYAPRAE